MWSGLPWSLTLQLISIHVQKVHEHLICREGVIKGRCNRCFPQAWGGQPCPHPPYWGAAPQSHHRPLFPPQQPVTRAPPASLGASGTDSAPAAGASRAMGTPRPSAARRSEREGLGKAAFRRASDALNPDTAR